MAAHYRAVIEYDGTHFAGFQVQPNARTVQGELEAVLARLCGNRRVRVRGAGRSDAGVHAQGQVIDFFMAWEHADEKLWRALNALLPDDVAVRYLERAPDAFHPRYSAVSRVYRYTIWNDRVRSPVARHFALHEPRPLDAQAMHEGAQFLVGEHDFASFGRPTSGETTVRHLMRADVHRQGAWVYVELEANAFLYRMARRIVGTLLPVGWGEVDPPHVREVLMACQPHAAGPAVAPQGLCLVAVTYREHEEALAQILSREETRGTER
ncbi:MAG: tRNA pseudouridine(38-40) synthase TruA [Ardenticatenia bacterium]|nr:tRNA pseudouridine(38-40) synthase TruA [Ardenticatenia bacterium]